MTAENREKCISKVLEHEGGFTDNIHDPGGPTNFGITIADARKYWKHNASTDDVRKMSKGIAVDIYRARYWSPLKCDDLPSGVDYSVFDYGVNSGISRSAKVLQRIASVADDGKIGDITIKAVGEMDPVAIIAAINDERLAFLKSLKTWSVFGRGWGQRVSDVRAMSLAMANDIPHNPVVALGRGKGVEPPDAQPA